MSGFVKYDRYAVWAGSPGKDGKPGNPGQGGKKGRGGKTNDNAPAALLSYTQSFPSRNLHQDPGVIATATYLRGVYERARTECLRGLADAQRAASFFLLQDLGPVLPRSNPGEVRAADLMAANEALLTTTLSILDDKLVDKLVVPYQWLVDPDDEHTLHQGGWYNYGRLVVLTRKAHPLVFSLLEDVGLVRFELLPPEAYSAPPASNDAPTTAVHISGAPETSVSVRSHPFANMANVRLTRMKVFLDEPRQPNSQRLITLTHQGIEALRTHNGDKYPAKVPFVVEHAKVEVPFGYYTGGYAFDPDKGFWAQATDGASMPSGYVTTPIPDMKVHYAPIGPFAVWELRIDPLANPGLAMSRVDRILIDIHGRYQHMPTHAATS